ncbi:hypothetical protein BSKO_00578 [Bryopsis sp. KO-2023]|nr:hypothetical protein BSKO_00578 [Bryopsis sp. KO-2023]
MKVVVSENEIVSLRSMLPSELNSSCNDKMAARYIRATGGDIKKAESRLRASLLWRKEFQPEKVVCAACRSNKTSHYLQVAGYCKLQRPVLYSCMKLSPNKDPEAGRAHMISRFEQAVRMMPEGVEQWIWFSDFHGFGLGDLNPSMARIFLDVSATHYPERLGVYFLVDTPTIFEVLWKMVKPLLDPVTAQKLVFVPYDVKTQSGAAKLRETLEEYFDFDLVEWLLREMAENRDKSKRQGKGFDFQGTYDSAAAGDLVTKQPHDLRGTDKILKQYLADPSLLLPQAEA